MQSRKAIGTHEVSQLQKSMQLAFIFIGRLPVSGVCRARDVMHFKNDGTEVKERDLKRDLVSEGLLTLALLVVFVFVMISFGSMGWFAQNSRAAGQDMGVNARQNDVEVAYWVYLYDMVNSTQSTPVVHYTGEGLANDPTFNRFDIPYFDTIFKNRNRYTPAVIRMQLTELQTTSGTVSLSLKRDTALPTMQNVSVGGVEKTMPAPFLSSVMRFTAAQGKGWYSYAPATAPVDLYQRLDASLYQRIAVDKDYTPRTVGASQTDPYPFEKGTSGVFVSSVATDANGAVTGVEKTDELVLTVPFDATDLVDTDGDGTADALNVYLYITYDEDLVDRYEISGIQSGGTTIGQIIDFASDLTEVTVSVSGS